MAKKYHIDINGNVAPCKAFLRECPRTDYKTEQEAYSALYLEKAAEDLRNAQEYVENTLRDPNTPSSFNNIDWSGKNSRNTARDYADKLEREFRSTGTHPELFSMRSYLHQSNVNSERVKQKVSINRIPAANYEDGIITSEWSLEIEENNRVVNKTVLDLNDDYKNEIERASHILRETVIANSNWDTPVEVIDKKAKFLTSQVRDSYKTIEEEFSGPAPLWGRNEGIGTFKDSDPANMRAIINYQRTTFRGRTFQRFLDDNPYYDASFPEIDVVVYDNEAGTSENLWAIRKKNEKWFIETTANGQRFRNPVSNVDEAYSSIHSFVKDYMRTSDEKTADKKASYVANLMTEVDAAIQNNLQRKKIRDDAERERLSRND